MEHFPNWQSALCLPTRQSRIISTTFTAHRCSDLSLKPQPPLLPGFLRKSPERGQTPQTQAKNNKKRRIKHIYLSLPSQLVKEEPQSSLSVYCYCFSPIIKPHFWLLRPPSLLPKELCTELARFVSLNLIEGICGGGYYWIPVLLSHLFPLRF